MGSSAAVSARHAGHLNEERPASTYRHSASCARHVSTLPAGRPARRHLQRVDEPVGQQTLLRAVVRVRRAPARPSLLLARVARAARVTHAAAAAQARIRLAVVVAQSFLHAPVWAHTVRAERTQACAHVHTSASLPVCRQSSVHAQRRSRKLCQQHRWQRARLDGADALPQEVGSERRHAHKLQSQCLGAAGHKGTARTGRALRAPPAHETAKDNRAHKRKEA